ncbi:MAG: CpXC domain-containing protein [Acidilobus sp.]|nr:CpXC domain-containing protein [Acidilobus sp.]
MDSMTDLQAVIGLLRDSLAGFSDELTCPHCGFKGRVGDFRLARAPWRFRNYVGRLLVCPRCGRRFRLFYPLRAGLRPFTVPRRAAQGNP